MRDSAKDEGVAGFGYPAPVSGGGVVCVELTAEATEEDSVIGGHQQTMHSHVQLPSPTAGGGVPVLV
jgi:hypothetical protein